MLSPAEVDALRADALAVDAASGRECGVGVPSQVDRLVTAALELP